jgi:xanthine dehydrogenase accessory factor
VIFGAGYDTEPLVRQSWALGFAVTVVDVREAFLTPERFPGATLVAAHYTQFPERVHLVPTSFVVIMNHHVERDRESLRFALGSAACYIGVLGPRARYDKLLTELASLGWAMDPARANVVRSPIGLDVGAETPDEVAMSIVSELLAIRRGFEGGFLTGSRRSLHRPADARLLARS